jgi:hypothetical protein
MKGLADSLRNLGEPVADRTLVLNLLCGLSPCYDHLKALIKRTVPFPTFHVVRNALLLEELTLTHDAPTLAVVLYSTIPSAQVSPRGQPPPPPARALRRPGPTLAPPPPTSPPDPYQHSTTDGSRRPHKGGRGGDGPSHGGPTGHEGGQSWSSFYNP